MMTGSPYLLFIDNVNRQNPECYIERGLKVSTSNICCLTGDTLVATGKGHLPIKDLVNKEVEIFDGVDWITVNSFKEYGESELYEVTLLSGQKIKMSPNHRCPLDSGKIKLVQNLKKGDILRRSSEFASPDSLKDEPGAYLKGFLIGDGTYSKGNAKLHVHSTKYMCINRIIESCKEVSLKDKFRSDSITEPHFGIEKSYPGGFRPDILSHYKVMKGLSVRDLSKWTLEYKEKLPEDIYFWSNKSKLDFLSGLFDADATGRGGIQFCSYKHQILKDVQRLLLTLGYRSSLDLKNSRLLITRWEGWRLFQELSMERLKLTINKPNRECKKYNKVVKVEKLKTKEKVYCPTIPTTSFFSLANGVLTGNTEIILYTDEDHSFVCCLSSLNLARWNEWKKFVFPSGRTVPQVAVYLLEAVMSEFLKKSKGMTGMGRARRFAEKSRALGLG